MKNPSYHEAMQRGTPDFPAELYHIEPSHPRYQMQTHWHREFELLRVQKGRLTLYLNETEHNFEQGDAVLIPGGIVHGADAFACVYECIVFSPSLLYVSQQCRSIVKSCVSASSFYKDAPLINGVFQALSQKKPGYEFDFLSGLYSLIRDIAALRPAGSINAVKTDKFEKIKPALTLIEENYNTQFTLSELASSCNMSPNYFCRFFKEMTQKTPFDYINIYRINAACEMLAAKGGSITEIAYNCGYNDLSYFTKIFKKYKGMPPKAYIQAISSEKK